MAGGKQSEASPVTRLAAAFSAFICLTAVAAFGKGIVRWQTASAASLPTLDDVAWMRLGGMAALIWSIPLMGLLFFRAQQLSNPERIIAEAVALLSVTTFLAALTFECLSRIQ